ncbi:DUF3024 domain-containing protein [Paenibacillus sp. 1P07SE]|uniref:DUF3024 domain-containing protein n=1 Tax=Paenibacillus sp. 1P07SE TaxID=3132209 RepID=UPI0039A6D435
MDEFTIRRLERILDGYIALKVPGPVRNAVRLHYQWDHEGLTLFEDRPDDDHLWASVPIVRFRFVDGFWCVQGKNQEGGWHTVPWIKPNGDFECQLEQVELDREGLFWIS